MNDHNDTSRNLPVLLPSTGRTQPGAERACSPFGAQLLGTGGVRRGLRGGQAVLQAARGAYLQAEWSGDADRREPAGLLARRRV